MYSNILGRAMGYGQLHVPRDFSQMDSAPSGYAAAMQKFRQQQQPSWPPGQPTQQRPDLVQRAVLRQTDARSRMRQ